MDPPVDGAEHRFDIDLDRPQVDPASIPNLPAWTALEQNKCPCCPLPDAPGAACPAAVDLMPMVRRFSALASIAPAEVRVVTEEREVRKKTDAQSALGALMGLVLASSGCPVLRRMRPMAQTHLPFGSMTETVYRMAAMQFFDCFLRGEPASIDGLRHFFDEIDQLDRAFAERLRVAAEKDASLNALLTLHSRVMLVSFSLTNKLERIRGWFEAD